MRCVHKAYVLASETLVKWCASRVCQFNRSALTAKLQQFAWRYGKFGTRRSWMVMIQSVVQAVRVDRQQVLYAYPTETSEAPSYPASPARPYLHQHKVVSSFEYETKNMYRTSSTYQKYATISVRPRYGSIAAHAADLFSLAVKEQTCMQSLGLKRNRSRETRL